MARTYLVFGDIEGKLDVLRVECTKCDRKGRYHVHKLIEKYGRKGNLMKWRETELDSRPAAPILSACCKGITGKSWSHYGRATVPCITSQAATSCPTNSATN